MNNDLTTRSAGRMATLVAIPLALITGIVMFAVLKPSSPPSEATPGPQSTAPVPSLKWKLSEREAAVCGEVLAKLPEKIGDLSRREVVGGPENHAAYGDPPMMLSCATLTPSFPPTEFLFTMDGVCWLSTPNGQAWVTVDREVGFTLMLPAQLSGDGSGQWAKAFTPAISGVPATASKPSGCR